MPNIDLLLENLAQVVKSGNQNKQTLFSILDFKTRKSLWMKQRENNVISALLAATPPGHTNFKQDFLA